jgi:hypothetical protein
MNFGMLGELPVGDFPMLIGYARVSTEDQHLHLQTDALTQAGCESIFTDEISGAAGERPGLTDALTFMRQGHTLVVWCLDRVGRFLKNLIAFSGRLKMLKGLPLTDVSVSSRTTIRSLFQPVRRHCKLGLYIYAHHGYYKNHQDRDRQG